MYVFLTGKPDNDYRVTTEDSLCVAKKSEFEDARDILLVKVVAHKDVFDDKSFAVKKNAFYVVDDAREFLNMHTDWAVADCINDYLEVKQNTFTKVEPYQFTNEEINDMAKQIRNCIAEYSDDNCSEYGCLEIAREWARNKASLIGAMKKHPKYNGRYQIVFDSDIERTIDKDMIRETVRDIIYASENIILNKIKLPFSRIELTNYMYSLEGKMNAISDVMTLYGNCVDENVVNTTKHDFFRYSNLLKEYDEKYTVFNGAWCTRDSYSKQRTFEHIAYKFKDYFNQFINSEMANFLYESVPELKIREGMKTSKAFFKICRNFGIDKHPNFDGVWRISYGDAINPFTVKKYTILSAHPVDYLLMSNGTNWYSCHSIDEGCYRSGTLSYMLDHFTSIFYTLDASYDGNTPELEKKEMRQCFHIGNDKVIQARLYPYDQTDHGHTAEPEDYVQYRNVVQKIVSEIYEVPNDWIISKGTSACCSVANNYGTHYPDITHYNNCNVSTLRNAIKADVKMHIGHDPICPDSGYEHSNTDTLNDESDRRECYECGCSYDEEDMHYIDGGWYCEDCCFYCDYHNRWEIGSPYCYVENYGKICEDAYDYSGDFGYCDNCGKYFWNEDGDEVYTEDGHVFCCEDCATTDDYVYVEDESGWYHRDDVAYCEVCGYYVLSDDYDDEHNMCKECYADKINNEEEAS